MDTEPSTEWRRANPVHAERPLKIICIGAGAAGLLFAYKLQRSFEQFDLTVYEKNFDIGGTWFENRYPGCACDVPSHNYTFSFEPWASWPAVYSGSKDIYRYFNRFCDKYQLRKYLKVQHQIIGATWNRTKNGYDVKVKELTSGRILDDFCNILVNGGGILNNWRWPAIPGLKNFKGTLLHTANYDEKVDLTDKVVGLIGNGSSGIQVLPAVQPICSKLTTFIREATWVSPINGLDQHHFTAEEQQKFEQDPKALLLHRKDYERGVNDQFGIFLLDTPNQQTARQIMTQAMKDKLQNDELARDLIPEWAVGCRRLTPGVGYLEALGKDNVEVVYGEIDRVTENGCVCDNGKEYKLDVLICATGFDTSFRPRFPLINHLGRNLQDDWAEEPKGYMGLAAPDYPNYFHYLGPNCPIGNGPLLGAMETQTDYMLKMITRWQTENWATFSPKMEAVEDFLAHKDQFMRRTVWQQPCRSWYKNDSATGAVTALWPGSSLHYIEAMKDVRYEDWNVEYEGNRFSWLGNGHSQCELDKRADSAYYLRLEDDGPYLSRGMARKIETKHGEELETMGGASFFDAVTGKTAFRPHL